MDDYERQVTVGSEAATLGLAGILALTALLDVQYQAGIFAVVVLLLLFAGVWFHLLPRRALGHWRFGAGTSVVQLIAALLLLLTGGVASDYLPYFLLPIMATAFVSPRASALTGSVALVALAALTLASAFSASPPTARLVVTTAFAVAGVVAIAAAIGRAAARARRTLRSQALGLSARNRELEVARRAAVSLSRARDQEELVRTAFASAREVMRAEMVLLLVAAGGAFRDGLAVTASGSRRFATDPSLTESPGRLAVRERRAVVVRDAAAEGTPLSPFIREELRLGSGVFVPLFARDQPFGIVIFGSTAPTQWTEQEVRSAEALAEASAAAVAAYSAIADLRQEAEALAERGRVFEGIDRLSDALAVSAGEREAAGAAARGLLEIFRLRAATTLLVDPSKAILEPEARAGTARDHPVVPDPGSCPAIRLGRAIRVEGPESPLTCPYMSTEGGGYACVPLLAAGEPVGAFFLEPPPGGVVDERAARAAADRAALTIGNARVLQSVRRQATTDALTGLYNRRFFDEQMRVTHSLAERHGDLYSVMAMDLDHLKELNDGLGHEAGDAALRAVASVLRDALRSSDLPARLGGDEFVVLMPRTGLAEAAQTGERVLAALRGHLGGQGHVRVAASAGLAGWRPGRSADDVLRAADAMLYRAKAGGRDRLVSEDEAA